MRRFKINGYTVVWVPIWGWLQKIYGHRYKYNVYVLRGYIANVSHVDFIGSYPYARPTVRLSRKIIKVAKDKPF